MFLCPVLAAVVLAPTTQPTAPPHPEEGWEDRFKTVYRLKEDEVLKRLAPPYIPERAIYYRIREKDQARAIKEPPTYFLFHWRNGELKPWGLGFIGGSGLTLGGVLHTILDLPSFEYEGPEDLMSIKLPGDWIVDPDAPLEQRFGALSEIVRKASLKKLRFEQQKLARSVIVVTGNYTAETRNAKGRRIEIDLYVDRPDADEGGGGGSGTMDQFIQRIGDLANAPVAIETSSRPIGTIAWRTHRTSYLYKQSAGAARHENLKAMLQHVTEQTGLEFSIEQRQMPVWIVGEEPK